MYIFKVFNKRIVILILMGIWKLTLRTPWLYLALQSWKKKKSLLKFDIRYWWFVLLFKLYSIYYTNSSCLAFLSMASWNQTLSIVSKKNDKNAMRKYHPSNGVNICYIAKPNSKRYTLIKQLYLHSCKLTNTLIGIQTQNSLCYKFLEPF